MKGINRSMVCREVASLAKGVTRGSVNRVISSDGDNGSSDSGNGGLAAITFPCKFGRYPAPGGGEDKPRFIFATREDAITAMQTIFEMGKKHFVIQIAIRYYPAYSEDGRNTQVFAGNTVEYALGEGEEGVYFTLSGFEVHIMKEDDNWPSIDSPDAYFITEAYASTISGLKYVPDAPYGSLVLVVVN